VPGDPHPKKEKKGFQPASKRKMLFVSVLLAPSKFRAALIKFSGLPIQANAAQQILEPRVGAQRVEAGP
jgi:hypothetical protein